MLPSNLAEYRTYLHKTPLDRGRTGGSPENRHITLWKMYSLLDTWEKNIYKTILAKWLNHV